MKADTREKLSRNKGLIAFVGAALLIAVALGVFVSPWASSSPDGLEKVGEDKGFANKAEEATPALEHSPMKDYAIPGVESEKVSTGLSGLIGVLFTAVAAVLVGLTVMLAGRARRKRTDGPAAGTDEA